MERDNDAESEIEQKHPGNIRYLLEELKSLLPPQLKMRKSGTRTREILSGSISYIKRLRQIINNDAQTNIENNFATQPSKTIEVAEPTNKKRMMVRELLEQRKQLPKQQQSQLQKSGAEQNSKFQSNVTHYPTVDTVTRLKVVMDYSSCPVEDCPFCKADKPTAMKNNSLQEKNEERLSGVQTDPKISLRDQDCTMPVSLEDSSMRPIGQMNSPENICLSNTLTGDGDEDNGDLWVGCEVEISETKMIDLEESNEIIQDQFSQEVSLDDEQSTGFTIEDISKENSVDEESNDCVIIFHGVDKDTAFVKDTENVQADFEDVSNEEFILGGEEDSDDSIVEIVGEDCKDNILNISDGTDAVQKVENGKKDSVVENVLSEADSGIKIDFSGSWFTNYFDSFLKKSDQNK